MKNKLKYLFLFVAILAVSGCQKDDLLLFDITDSGVMFPGAGDARTYRGYNASDRTYYVNESFLNIPLTQEKYIIDFPVRVSGDSVNFDREVAYDIVAGETTALTSQYRIIDAVIPAGERYGRIRFELTRDAALDNAAVKVTLRLKDSQHLKVGSNEYKTGVLTWSNMLAMYPATANFIRTYNCIILSPLTRIATANTYYSPNAHKAILDALGWPFDYWPAFSSGFADPGTGTSAMFGAYYTDLYARKLKEYLDAYAAANGGVRLKHNAGLANGVEIQPRIDGAVYKP